MIEALIFCPGGTRENSPPILSVGRELVTAEVPEGRLEEKRASSVPPGLIESVAFIVPSTEDAGLVSEVPPGLRCLEGPILGHSSNQ